MKLNACHSETNAVISPLFLTSGWMAERLKAHAWKVCRG